MSPVPVIGNLALTESEWDQVHAQVQSALERLAERVRCRHPSAIVRAGGKTSGRVWSLYSHRGFNLTQDDTDAEDIVAGVIFTPEGDHVRVYADIGGAETGQTDYEAPERVVPASLPAVLQVARELAEDLAQQDEIVIKAMSERRPPPDYRNGLV